jgi:putative membrane protein
MSLAETSSSEQQDRDLLAVPTRQAPAAVVFLVLKFIRSLGLIQIGAAIAFIVSGRIPVQILGLIPVVGSVVLAIMILSWWRFVFVLDGDELVVARGILSQERLSIPLGRIQSVSIEQNVLNRLLGLVSLKVDTAGSDVAELDLSAIGRAQADALQRLAAGRQQVAPAAASPGSAGDLPAHPDDPTAPARADEVGEVLVQRTPTELLKVALARWPWAGLLVLAPLLAFGGELGSEFIGDRIENFFFASLIERATGASSDFEATPIALLAIVGIVVTVVSIAALVGMILQVTQVVTTDWNLRLERTSTGLRRTAGLFNTTSKASTLTRVQQFRLSQNVLEKRFGFARVSMATIGEGDLSIPGSDPNEVAKLRAVVLPDADPPVPDRGIDRAWVFFNVRGAVLFVLIGVAVGLFFVPPWPLVALVLLPIQYWATRRRWRLRRWGITSNAIVDREEFFGWDSAEMELFRTQSVQVAQSFFERRRGLATVTVRAAEGKIEIPMIPLAEANYVRDLALYTAETSSRRWM